MIKFLIVEQDLRVSGTSQGVISRSFLAKLRMSYPDAVIDVVYLRRHNGDDQLQLLPVNNIETRFVDIKVPFFTKLINRIYWRVFHKSLVVEAIHKAYASHISKIDYHKYDHIFIRSAGLEHEVILGTKDLPILKKAIVNFHDPYPEFWYSGSKKEMTPLAMFKMKKMYEIVCQAKTCMSSAYKMSHDLEYLFGTRKKFYTLPHQYSESVFDLSDIDKAQKKNKKITIAYHGAIQFGRNVEILLEAYRELVQANPLYKNETDFVLRMKGINMQALSKKYADTPNIVLLDTLNFSNSCYEQQHFADINIILENGPIYCNILVGKAPFLGALCKPVFCLSPERSELRDIVKDERFIANMNDKEEIKQKLEGLIQLRLKSDETVYPFGDFFSDGNFTKSLNKILADKPFI